jgi:rhamnosyltransferase
MVASIIVVYKPSDDVINNLVKISEQSDVVIVVVNEADKEFFRQTEKLPIMWVKNDKNMGLSIALNQGLVLAFSDPQISNVILFDQDSQPTVQMIHTLRTQKKILEASYKCHVIVGPLIYDIKDLMDTWVSVKTPFRKVSTLITSGMMISRQVYDLVGGMNEEYFIDCIDHDYSFRALSKKIMNCQVMSTSLIHNMGDKRFRFFGKNKPLHDSNIRHYYIIRNTILLLKKPYVPSMWRISEFFKLIRRCFAYPLLASRKIITAKFILIGIKDGIFNLKGEKIIK